MVALLAEGVDRNKVLSDNPSLVNSVALLAEGVDRNRASEEYQSYLEKVALLAEGVDRNSGKQRAAVEAESRPPRGGRG